MLGHSCRICSLSVGLDPGFSEALKCRYKGPRDLEVLIMLLSSNQYLRAVGAPLT